MPFYAPAPAPVSHVPPNGVGGSLGTPQNHPAVVPAAAAVSHAPVTVALPMAGQGHTTVVSVGGLAPSPAFQAKAQAQNKPTPPHITPARNYNH